MGPRSQETEKILKEFRKNKQQVKERLENLKDRLKEQARFCKAAMIQRVPRVAAETLRLLDRQKLLGRNVLIVGTNALYAYEFKATELRMFPKAILTEAEKDISELELPSGFDTE